MGSHGAATKHSEGGHADTEFSDVEYVGRNIDKGMHIYAYYECNDEQGDLISFQIVLANKEGE